MNEYFLAAVQNANQYRAAAAANAVTANTKIW